MNGSLHETWAATLEGLDGDASTAEPALDLLVARYTELPPRRYHNAVHMAAVVRGVVDFSVYDGAEQCDDLPATLAAAFFHDAVYFPHARDNEARSAELAKVSLVAHGVPEGRADRVAALVMTTADHALPDDPALQRDAAVLIDADLAVLALPTEAYTVFTAAVREEYSFVPDEQWREGRVSLLDSLLSRDRIYLSPAGQHFERAARANMQAERDLLTGEPR